MADPASARNRIVHRVSRGPDPWRWTPWEYAPFNGRWDDPDAAYRVLYVGASKYACLLEVLAAFRPDPKILALHADLTDDPANAEFPTTPVGHVPVEWVAARAYGRARMRGRYLAVGEDQALAWLRPRVARLMIARRVLDLDREAVRSADREFTQALSRWLYEHADPDTAPFDGIEFESRHGNRLVLWALFERGGSGTTPHVLTERRQEPLSTRDLDLRRALRRHGLVLG